MPSLSGLNEGFFKLITASRAGRLAWRRANRDGKAADAATCATADVAGADGISALRAWFA
ncbi:MAG: hypothetical protein ABIU85_00550 [Methylotenera sp.]